MTRPLVRRDALNRRGAAVVGLSPPAWLGGCAPPVVRNARARRPNVVFIMTDDHNQSAMGAYGNTLLKTPTPDRIAAGGLRFDLGFVTNALCLPTRARFLPRSAERRVGQADVRPNSTRGSTEP